MLLLFSSSFSCSQRETGESRRREVAPAAGEEAGAWPHFCGTFPEEMATARRSGHIVRWGQLRTLLLRLLCLLWRAQGAWRAAWGRDWEGEVGDTSCFCVLINRSLSAVSSQPQVIRENRSEAFWWIITVNFLSDFLPSLYWLFKAETELSDVVGSVWGQGVRGWPGPIEGRGH